MEKTRYIKILIPIKYFAYPSTMLWKSIYMESDDFRDIIFFLPQTTLFVRFFNPNFFLINPF